MNLSCAYDIRPARPSCGTAFVQSAFGIDPRPGHNVIARDVAVDYRPGRVVLFAGPSGSGKSSMLRQALRQARSDPDCLPAERLDDSPADPDAGEALIDALGPDARAAARLLSLCGLGEATLMLRSPAELSDGQRYRYAVARLLAGGARTIAADEWCAKLDRVTAKVVSRNVRRIATRRGVGFLLATAHEDLIDDLRPDAVVRCRGGGRVEVEQQRPFAARSVFSGGSRSPRAPRRTGRTSLGGITGGGRSGRSGA